MSKSPDESNKFMATAMNRFASSLPPEILVDLVEKHGVGQGKGAIYASLFGGLRNSLPKLNSVLGEMPPSNWRGSGFQILFKRSIANPENYSKSLGKLSQLSEQEDIRGAALGIFEARQKLLESDSNLRGFLTEAETDAKISEDALKIIRSIQND